VDGIKAAAVLSRLCPDLVFDSFSTSLGKKMFVDSLESHHLSGLVWALDCLSEPIPLYLQEKYKQANIPFRFHPGFVDEDFDVSTLSKEVAFKSERIVVGDGREVVKERRQTAWQGDRGVPGFAYSGKIMERLPFSPLVEIIKNKIFQKTGKSFDCCLLNLYPDGESGMRYHSDPDQGTLWGFDSCVVSVGAARRFAFRQVGPKKQSSCTHNFVVMHGDMLEMFDDCQEKFQHTVKPSEDKKEEAPRASLVFKQSLQQDKDYNTLKP